MATIRIIKGRLYYQFRYKGVRCVEKAGLENTKENLKKTGRLARLIQAEIDNGIFRYEQHFPHGAKIELFAPKREDQPFNQYFADWMASKILRRPPGELGRPSGSTSTPSSKSGCSPPLPGVILPISKKTW
jgi:hypothetical protein